MNFPSPDRTAAERPYRKKNHKVVNRIQQYKKKNNKFGNIIIKEINIDKKKLSYIR